MLLQIEPKTTILDYFEKTLDAKNCGLTAL